ncbi:Uncharacterised protein [Metamycoplasma cloacale]|uniref:Uncharacterized protein n=1 Tax=Metamycoplasma cloacale TaxID=92401 RepID=A0A2Z4LLJ3_9BACT|nr:variable surface lipoprotein [Metamycoplasma cloacale]AWX42593.1 hypothetical protein DK849_00640 [Metamycoplasma cloacale]VEU79678.1 Uncharacterised protein [Metamycoplasma cloacale]
MKKKWLLPSLAIAPIIATPMIAASCDNKGPINNQNLQKLTSTQIEQIKNSFVFELTEEGRQQNYRDVVELLKNKVNYYLSHQQFNAVQSDVELSKWVKLKWININDIQIGHNLKILFQVDSNTQLLKLKWEVSCEAFGTEGSGEETLEK